MPSSLARRITIAVCCLLLLGFGILSWAAERTKSATYDEPQHAIAGYVLTQDGDYRLDPEDPPLWQRWANLLVTRGSFKADLNAPAFRESLSFLERRTTWLRSTLYDTSVNDADPFLMRQRIMLIVLGVLLGGLIAWWALQLGGPMAALAATLLFVFDPNFLAHTTQIKNDVPITLVGFALCYSIWRMGNRLTLQSVLAVVLLAAMAMVTKFSWPLLVFSMFELLLVRVLIPHGWNCCGGAMARWWKRLGIAMATVVLVAVVGFVMIWANYSFRFAPGRDGALWDFHPLLLETELGELSAQHQDRKPTLEELKNWQPSPMPRLLVFCNEHHLVPQTYLYGILYTYRSSRQRFSFLNNQISLLGHWYYFPEAFVCKLPIATLAAVGLALLYGLSRLHFRRRSPFPWGTCWTVACIAIPALTMTIASMNSTLNLGFRHFLPVMPFIYLATALALASAWQQWGRVGRWIGIALLVALAVETLKAFPDYIAFFNVACGGSEGGIKYLGDSNLDWGQDLPLLAKWQRENPNLRLYLSYFGTANPHYYGIRYIPVAGNIPTPPNERVYPDQPGVLAISATNLQGVYLNPRDKAALASFHLVESAGHKPIDVLGGTIYIYLIGPPR
jgi:hypothetical protein